MHLLRLELVLLLLLLLLPLLLLMQLLLLLLLLLCRCRCCRCRSVCQSNPRCLCEGQREPQLRMSLAQCWRVTVREAPLATLDRFNAEPSGSYDKSHMVPQGSGKCLLRRAPVASIANGLCLVCVRLVLLLLWLWLWLLLLSLLMLSLLL